MVFISKDCRNGPEPKALISPSESRPSSTELNYFSPPTLWQGTLCLWLASAIKIRILEEIAFFFLTPFFVFSAVVSWAPLSSSERCCRGYIKPSKPSPISTTFLTTGCGGGLFVWPCRKGCRDTSWLPLCQQPRQELICSCKVVLCPGWLAWHQERGKAVPSTWLQIGEKKKICSPLQRPETFREIRVFRSMCR